MTRSLLNPDVTDVRDLAEALTDPDTRREALEIAKAINDDLSLGCDVRKVFELVENSNDVTIIADDYFVAYTQELVDDCFELPKSTDWPYRHLEMDWEGAAVELKDDYSSFEYNGNTYWVHS